MRKYLCMWRSKKVEVDAETTYQAQIQAAVQLKAKRTYEVSVYLMTDSEGNAVEHSTATI